jgi:hypothetical protein
MVSKKFEIDYSNFNPDKEYFIKNEKASKSNAKLIHYDRLANRERSKAEREKLSIAGKGKKMPKDAIEKIRKANTDRLISSEHKAKISKTLKGRKLSKETCEKMSESRTGMKHSNSTIKKLEKAAQKRCVFVSQFTLDGVWIKDFIGLKEAAELIGHKNGRAIQLVCNYYRDNLTKGSKQSGGFIWKYKTK